MKFKGILIFDIDGVIRDVSNSYRLAIQKTVETFSLWHPPIEEIDFLKSEGCWNNDYETSLELIKRRVSSKDLSIEIPSIESVIDKFCEFYFGGNPDKDPKCWKGFILNEPLLVKRNFFSTLTKLNIAWGFVSGAEPQSVKFVLENRIGISSPAFVALGDAPEKPNPKGLIYIAEKLLQKPLDQNSPPIAYLGDTVADVLTIINARKEKKSSTFISFAVAPPHLHSYNNKNQRFSYEQKLLHAGADHILNCTEEVLNHLIDWSN